VNTFASAAGDAVEIIGPAALRGLAADLERGRPENGSTVHDRSELVAAIHEARRRDGLDSVEAVAYLRGVADGYARRDAVERVEPVWSGPHDHTVPVRSTARALVDLVAGARDRLWLMTYSARPHPPVMEALCAARSRGTAVSVVVETLQGAAGALGGTEPGAAFLAVPEVQLWHWPVARRPDRSARMHAKIAVADRRTLLVSSANLTQSGVDTNIEAGLLVHGGAAPRRAAEHLDALVADGTLARLFVGQR
jgi:phosphatidylserine/phosphatidylglycerophosphate/cardiolipin synthase-like enzyme